MKKILIVEDTPINLESAKKFFATISNFEFIYTTNRYEAQQLLSTVDALITDRSIPFCSSDTINNYSNLRHGENDYKIVLNMNGYDLLAQAVVLGIPRLMFSNHGTSNFLLTLDNKELCEKALDLKGDDYDGTHRYEVFSPVDSEAKRNRLDEDITKDKSSSWALAWTELQKQF